MSKPHLKQSILITLAYFDVFDYPMTYLEIWKWLYRTKCDLADVITAVDALVAKGVIAHTNGCFYFPREGVNMFQLRQDQYLWSERLWDRALMMSKIISAVPCIQMIAIVNSLAFFNSDPDSDIDFLIVAKKGKIWTVRAITGVLLFMLGLKRHGNKTKARACLSFYITDDALDLSGIAQDQYSLFVAYWVSQTAPVWDRDQLFERYLAANAWTKEYLPNSIPAITNYYYDFHPPLMARIVRFLLTPILYLHVIERIGRFIQKKKVSRSQRARGNPSSVVTTDQILKFHPIDHRPQYFERIKARLDQLDPSLKDLLE